jgi:hypothetical protein
MTRRVPCPPAPGPLEGYAARFDDLFGSLAQRRGFRECLTGLPAPRDRNKTLTALAGAGPVTGAQHPAVQRLQFFLPESRWDPERVNDRRLELLLADPATAPHRGTRAYGPDARTPVDAARELAWGGPDDPGDRHPVTRIFRDGHAGTWRAAEATLGWRGPDGARRLAVAAADPGTLPPKAAWYLVTNLPRPGGPREPGSPRPAADLAEITRIYGIRHWIERSCKQVKDELGWADSQARSDIAIRRCQVLANCAFSFCRDAWFADPAPPPATPPAPGADGGERGARTRPASPAPAQPAPGNPGRPRLAGPLDRPAALEGRTVERAPAPAAASPDDVP